MGQTIEASKGGLPLQTLQDPLATIVMPAVISQVFGKVAMLSEPVLGVCYDKETGDYKMKVVDQTPQKTTDGA